MSSTSDRRLIARWVFHGTGLILLFAGPYFLRYLTNVEQQAQVLFPYDEPHQAGFQAAASGLILAASLVCLLTSRGLRLGRSWARWTGMLACSMLLPLFPLLTLAGVAGICVFSFEWPRIMAAKPEPESKPAVPSTDYWTAKRKSPAQRVVATVIGVLALVGLGVVGHLARLLGMQSWDPGIFCLPALWLIDLTVHEMGHVTMAWALHNRLHAINVGPFTFRDFGHGYHFHFDWKRMFAWNGFVSSASLTGDNLRGKLIAEVAGGPGAALLAGFIMAAVFLSLPGTPLAALWWIPGYLAVIFLSDVVLNSMPVGYSDGSMLFHLILWTDAGKLLIGSSVVAQIREDAQVLFHQADFAKRVELWKTALDGALKGGERNSMMIAYCHGMLGAALYSTDDWAAAESEFRKCLEFKAECTLESGLVTTCWLLLQSAAHQRHEPAEAHRAYEEALSAVEAQRRQQDRLGQAVMAIFAAGAHLRAGAFEKAVEEAQTVIATLPAGRERTLLRVCACSIRARAQLAMGAREAGRASASETAEILHSSEVPDDRRNNAWDDLADLGVEVWELGEPAIGEKFVRDAVAGLQSGGAAATAAHHRIRLARLLRTMGRLSEARQSLPEEPGLPDYCVRQLLAERVRLNLAVGEPLQAIADGERLLPHWNGEPLETALTGNLLAEACLDAGDHLRAGELAHQAAEVLGPWQHYEMAACMVTMALAERLAGGRWLPEYGEKALQLIEADSLLDPAGKKRLLDAQAARLERYRAAASAPAIASAAVVGQAVVPAAT